MEWSDRGESCGSLDSPPVQWAGFTLWNSIHKGKEAGTNSARIIKRNSSTHVRATAHLAGTAWRTIRDHRSNIIARPRELQPDRRPNRIREMPFRPCQREQTSPLTYPVFAGLVGRARSDLLLAVVL